MAPYYQDDSVTLYHGDCVAVLAELPDASVDAVVTDPPYNLTAGKRGGTGAASVNLESPYGRSRIGTGNGPGGFMGQSWDDYDDHEGGFQGWCTAWASECLRVLKPGGHLLSFGGSRTWHRLAAAVEDAGFEIRDSIAWLYGSGFPKSLDVAKAIDKQRDDSAEVRAVCRWLRARIDEHPEHTIRSIADQFGFHSRMVEHWAARDTDSQPSLPTREQWAVLGDLLGLDDPEMTAEVNRLNDRKGEFGEAFNSRDVTGTVDEWTDRTNYALTARDGLRRDNAFSADAKRWEGWGTALKPSFEPIVVGRKPLAGTVATNVLQHGTGALNIEACRVGDGSDSQGPRGADEPSAARRYADRGAVTLSATPGVRGGSESGRWPTNVVLDEHQAAALDEQTGVLKSGANPTRRSSDKFRNAYGDFAGQTECVAHRGADEGGASRFFPVFRYEAKAPTGERPSVDGVAHPTVKPLDLMRWLVRLVTPPGGLVLDPFAGSGTTAEACIHEHMRCITIEREVEYLPLIVGRLTKPIAVGFDFGSVQ